MLQPHQITFTGGRDRQQLRHDDDVDDELLLIAFIQNATSNVGLPRSAAFFVHIGDVLS